MLHGPLSLPARLCLLAWDTARPAVDDTAQLPGLVRAGALVDLARRGLLIDEDGIATPVDMDSRTGDAVLDGLLELIHESRPHFWRRWVTLRARVTLDAVREQMVAEGWLRAEKIRVLGVFPSVEYALERTAAAQVLRREVRQVLTGTVPVTELSERDAAVAALAAAAELFGAAVAPERRVEELTGHAGAASPALRGIVSEVRRAVVAGTPAPVSS
ncbi:GPP34 family phosphoprotein [Streptomyces sp. NPDC058741]|uniref:GOLPH3/VPS74 family protein n=1 Tax=Streptomyces sp. NPDC058741 TaxID=3346620 RepID=UPI00368506A8